MTVTYCGTCGTANGAAAKFCRHCGAELSAQSPLTSSNTATTSNGNGATFAAKRAQLRVVAPETEIIPLAPAAHIIELAPPVVEETQHASETLRRLRDAKVIELHQEEAARQHKQAVSQRLSQRLAQASAAPLENKPSIPLVTPKQLKNPLVPIRPQQAEAEKPASPEFKDAASRRERNGFALNPASAIAQVKEQNRSGLAVRIAASMLGVSLLFGGVYAYRHQVFSGHLIGGARNLLSPEEQSAQLLQAGRTDLEAGKVEEATQKLERAIALTPNEPITREQLAEAYVQRGRTEEALNTLDDLLKLAPEHLDARLKLAALQQRKGNLHEARAQYQKIINLAHDSAQAAQALDAIETIDTTLNAATLANNHNDAARQRRNASLKRVGPVLPVTALTRPPVTLTGRPAATVNNYFDWSPRRSLEAPDPRAVAAMHKETGMRYFNIREYGAALRELQQAARLTPGDKDLYYFLGGAYRGLGQPLKAFDNYKRCDNGTYASVAQSGAKQTEKAARKEYQQAQELRDKNAPQVEAAKEASRHNALQNLSAPIIAPFGGRAAFNPSPQQ